MEVAIVFSPIWKMYWLKFTYLTGKKKKFWMLISLEIKISKQNQSCWKASHIYIFDWHLTSKDCVGDNFYKKQQKNVECVDGKKYLMLRRRFEERKKNFKINLDRRNWSNNTRNQPISHRDSQQLQLLLLRLRALRLQRELWEKLFDLYSRSKSANSNSLPL